MSEFSAGQDGNEQKPGRRTAIRENVISGVVGVAIIGVGGFVLSVLSEGALINALEGVTKAELSAALEAQTELNAGLDASIEALLASVDSLNNSAATTQQLGAVLEANHCAKVSG